MLSFSLYFIGLPTVLSASAGDHNNWPVIRLGAGRQGNHDKKGSRRIGFLQLKFLSVLE